MAYDARMPLYVAEGQLTSAVLRDPRCYEHVRWLDPDLFRWPTTREVYVACQWVLRDHPDISGEELTSRVKDVLIEYGKGEALKLLTSMFGEPSGTPVNVNLYATSIFEARRHEDMRSAATRLMQIVGEDYDLARKRVLFDETYRELIAYSEDEPGWKPIEGLERVADFMTADDQTYEWVIPALLERQERFMLIAPEKAGKTVLTRQVCLMLASGRHPLSEHARVPPMRSLLVDLENPAPVARRDFRRQVEQLEDFWADDNDRAFILHRPAGIHLGDPHDRLLLRRAMEHVRPDLLCISPIYKAYDGLAQSWEEQAFGVQKPLDNIRQEFDCAIWMEHHAPGGVAGRREIRPFGSTRWGRWLDYQAALNPTAECPRPPYKELWWNSQRRDERKMAPMKLRRGVGREPSWMPVWEDGDIGFDLAVHEAEM